MYVNVTYNVLSEPQRRQSKKEKRMKKKSKMKMVVYYIPPSMRVYVSLCGGGLFDGLKRTRRFFFSFFIPYNYLFF